MDHEEPELRALDAALENRTSHMITKIMSNRDHGSGSLPSLDSLVIVIQCLSESNKDVVRVLLRSKKDIHGSRELLSLLIDYFNCSHTTLDFLNTLQLWLHGGNGISRQLERVASRLVDIKKDKTNTISSRILLDRAMNDFLVAADDTVIMTRLRTKLEAVLHDQKRLYEKFIVKKEEVDHRKIEHFKVYRRVTTTILASVYLGLVVCAAVSAVLSPPLVIPTLAAFAAIAAMNPTEGMRRWTNYMWDKYEVKLKRRNELVNALMGLATSPITVADLEGIRVAVNALREKMENFSVNVNAKDAVKDRVVKTMIDHMEKKINEFSRAVKDLESKKDECYKDITTAKKKIIQTALG